MNNTCNCKHNHNSNSDEPCCRCDSRVPENDNAINKVTSLEIIVRMVDSKPYYEIKYKKVGEDYYHVGYSSYNLNNVVKWYGECFELVNVKMTNADRIRSMSDEELAEWLTNMTDDFGEDEELYKSIYNLDTKKVEDIHDSYGDLLEWLQSPVDDEVSDAENFEVRR